MGERRGGPILFFGFKDASGEPEPMSACSLQSKEVKYLGIEKYGGHGARSDPNHYYVAEDSPGAKAHPIRFGLGDCDDCLAPHHCTRLRLEDHQE
jgi:hypothetical protein